MSKALGGGGNPPPLWRRWAALLLGGLLIMGFMFGFVPWVTHLSSVRPLTDYVDGSGIHAQGLYYTEVEEAAESESVLRDTWRFRPHKR